MSGAKILVVEDDRLVAKDYSKIFRSSPISTVVTTVEEDRILEANDAFARLSGWSRDHVVGRTLSELGWWSRPEERERLVDAVRERGVAHEQEMQVRRRSGELREALASAEILEGEGTLVTQIHDISERKAFERNLECLALRDPLTGLPNRTLFLDRLAHAMHRAEREGRRVAALLVDLDRFEVVNDRLGHPNAQELLRSVVERVRGCLREDDTLARFGEAVLAAILEGIEEKDDVRQVAERFVLALETPFAVEHQEVRLSASLGIAVQKGGEGAPEELIRFADRAMSRARNEQGTSYHVFDPARDSGTEGRLDRENELWSALARDEFTPLYQPMVSLRTEEIVGCEALARWNHPERGLVPPGEFIEPAERSGLIVPMSERLIRRTCEDLGRWCERFGRRDLVLSANFSARQFEELELARALEVILAESGIVPNRFQLEVDESTVIRNSRQIAQLRGLGFQLAIDNFGTGHSSLQNLRDIDVDSLKVDASFTRDIGRSGKVEHMLRTIIRFAHGLGLSVIAEGIETREQHRFLRHAGCDRGQGYLYSQPVPPDVFEELLDQPSPFPHEATAR